MSRERRSLQDELDELERTDPEVRAAAERLDAVTARLLALRAYCRCDRYRWNPIDTDAAPVDLGGRQ